jgi:hypothetical protein
MQYREDVQGAVLESELSGKNISAGALSVF